MERDDKRTRDNSEIPATEENNELLKLYDRQPDVGMLHLRDLSIEDLYTVTRKNRADSNFSNLRGIWKKIAVEKYGTNLISEVEELLLTLGTKGLAKKPVCRSTEDIDYFRVLLVLHVVSRLKENETSTLRYKLGDNFFVEFCRIQKSERYFDCEFYIWPVGYDYKATHDKFSAYIKYMCLKEETERYELRINENNCILRCQSKRDGPVDLSSVYRVLYRILSVPGVYVSVDKKLFELEEVGEGEQKKLVTKHRYRGRTMYLRNKV